MSSLINANRQSIREMVGILDRLEECLLRSELRDSLIHDLMEVGYWANELLQVRISYEERQSLLQVIQRVKYLQKLYMENALNLRSVELTKELKELVSDEAWRVFLRLDEVRGMELEFFQKEDWRIDYNLDLISSEQDLNARLSAMKLKTY